MEAGKNRSGPLADVRVIDLTHILNGPFSTMLLAHMGADVIKIEHAEGDRWRHQWLPADADHDAYEFMVVNANKRGITLNLKDERGRQMFLALVKQADIVTENFSVGVMNRLGLGYEELKKVNPKIIYGYSRGYGDSGPYSNVRANAGTINAMTGWTDSSWNHSGSPGTKAQGVGDETAGVSLALGLIAALYAREKTGIGQKVEIAMQEALLGFMMGNLHEHFEGSPIGNTLPKCADGYVTFHLPAMTDATWTSFASTIGHPEVLEDPRFVTNEARRHNFGELEKIVDEWVRGSTRAELWEVFKKTAISAAPVLSVAEMLEDEQLRERGAFVEIDDPRSGKLRLLAPWIRFSETPSSIRTGGAGLGQHNHDVYSELLGLTSDEIDNLEKEEVI